MIDTVFSFCLIILSLCFAGCFVLAIKGNYTCMFVCAFYAATLMADKAWSTREAGFLYGFLKGLLQ